MNIALPRHVSGAMKWSLSFALLLSPALLPAAAAAQNSPPPPSLPDHIGGVHGTIAVADPSGPAPGYIPLPCHQLQLHDKFTGVFVDQAESDVHGRYYFPPQELGTYTLSWPASNGWSAGVYPEDVVIAQGTFNPHVILLTPQLGNSTVVGNLTLADGSRPGMVDEYFGIESVPEVSVRSGNGAIVAGPVKANAKGNYALSYRSVGIRKQRVVASIEGVSVQRKLYSLFGIAMRRNMVFPNSPPEVITMYATNSANNAVQRAYTGDVLTTQDDVMDPDGDSISIEWKPGLVSAAPFVTQTGNQAQWTIPGASGLFKLYAVVGDGRGGYARGSVSVSLNKHLELFTGVLRNRSGGAPIRDASVEINGLRTTSGSNGDWILEVPVADSYLVNIRHADYALAGTRSDRGIVGRVWEMVPRMSEWIDPRQQSRVTDDRSELGELRGATVTLPANTMVDASGNVAQAPLRVSLATLDLSDDQAVDNWGARTPQGITGLVSYGVISIEVTDAQGREYQVRPGGRALVNIPIMGLRPGDAIPEGAPQEIPVWSYIEEDGFWHETGRATLDRQQALYRGYVTHFSEINLDVPNSDSSIRVLCDPSLLGKTLRVSDVAGNGIDYANVEEGLLDEPLSSINYIYPSQLIKLEVLDGPGGSVIPGVVIDVFYSAAPGLGHVEQTSPEVLAGPPGPIAPPYPYDGAPLTVTLKWQTPPQAFFLHNKGQGNSVDATDYYTLMNAAGNRDTLEEWWATNGFNPIGIAAAGAGEQYARTSYQNDNDLGSGRDMHLFGRADGTKVAWVANYGLFNQAHGNADIAALQISPGATVCMEYSPMENAAGDYIDAGGAVVDPLDPAAVEAASVTKFFVFQDADGVAGAELQIAADLDGYGPKFVPNLCLNCHGGSANNTYASPGDGQLNAYFRELDYPTYNMPPSVLGFALADQQAAFKTQNEIVRGSSSSLVSSAPIKELIDIWYQGGAGDVTQDDCVVSGTVVDPASIPAGWHYSGNLAFDQFYCDVISKSCRTCHLAHDGIPFDSISLFDSGQYYANQTGFYASTPPDSGTMPHAVITYRNFWLSESPFRPDAVIDFLLNNDL